jgi:hypothetical protein
MLVGDAPLIVLADVAQRAVSWAVPFVSFPWTRVDAGTPPPPPAKRHHPAHLIRPAAPRSPLNQPDSRSGLNKACSFARVDLVVFFPTRELPRACVGLARCRHARALVQLHKPLPFACRKSNPGNKHGRFV